MKIRKTNLECALESTGSLFGVSLQQRRWQRDHVESKGDKRFSGERTVRFKPLLMFWIAGISGRDSFPSHRAWRSNPSGDQAASKDDGRCGGRLRASRGRLALGGGDETRKSNFAK